MKINNSKMITFFNIYITLGTEERKNAGIIL
jgi:hypothetical protein